MRYTEKDLKTKYDNFTDYLSSIIELLILSPFRLINEISKKVVYLEQKRIEKMLLVAAMISVLVIALEVVIGFYLNDFNPVSGKFPIAFQALAPIIILLLWGFVKNYDFSLHSKLEEILTKQSEAEDLTKEDENTVKESKSSPKTENTFTGFQEDEDTSQDEKIELDDFDDDSFEEQFGDFGQEGFSPEGSQTGELQPDVILPDIDTVFENDENNYDDLEYDCDGIDPKEFINQEIYNKPEIKSYQNQHQKTVEKLHERDKKPNKGSLFNEEELQMLQKLCDEAVENSKYFDDSTIEIALNNQKFDDFSQVDDFMANDEVDWLQKV